MTIRLVLVFLILSTVQLHAEDLSSSNYGRCLQGPPGPPGPRGPDGPRGDKGLAGNPGANGLNGLHGMAGAQGPTGCTGPRGEKGCLGFQGDYGPRGARGSTGETGPQGITGDTGPTCTPPIFQSYENGSISSIEIVQGPIPNTNLSINLEGIYQIQWFFSVDQVLTSSSINSEVAIILSVTDPDFNTVSALTKTEFVESGVLVGTAILSLSAGSTIQLYNISGSSFNVIAFDGLVTSTSTKSYSILAERIADLDSYIVH